MPSLSERYLARLGIERPATTDYAGLETILHAHLRAIPFETLTSFTGSPVSLDPEDVYAKLLEGKRGGYCMEHALLSRRALAELGFKTEPSLARVYVVLGDEPGAQTHAVTLVHIGDKTYMFDPGFGRQTPKHPLSLDVGSTPQEGRWGTYRFVLPAESDVPELNRGADAQLVLQEKTPDGWSAMYGLTKRPVVEPDITAFNWFVSTYPGSVFVRGMMFARWDGDSSVGGMDATMRKRSGGNVEVVELDSLEAVRRALRDEMQLGVDDALIEKVWENLVKKGKVAALSK